MESFLFVKTSSLIIIQLTSDKNYLNAEGARETQRERRDFSVLCVKPTRTSIKLCVLLTCTFLQHCIKPVEGIHICLADDNDICVSRMTGKICS